MADIRGFALDRAPLRALFHAQCSLVKAQNRTLLFYAADILNAAKPYLSEQDHEDAIKSADALAHLKDNPYQIHCLMGFQVNGLLSAAYDVLTQIKDAALGEDQKDLQKLVSKTHEYFDMAMRIQNPDYTEDLVHVSQIDPVVAAEFINLYMRQFVSAKPPLTANLMANPLARDKQHLYEIGEANKEYISILLDDLSAEADYCRLIAKDNTDIDEYDPRIYRLNQLFQSCAVFDRLQYEDGAPPKENTETADVLTFRPPAASHG